MVVCPSCHSSKVRNGYRKAPLVLRLLRINEFLCEHCNLQFLAFSLRAPKSRGARRKRLKANTFNQAPEVDLSLLNQPLPTATKPGMQRETFDRSAIVNETLSRPKEPDYRLPATSGENAEAAVRLSPKHRAHQARHLCPQCGSQETRRRHRRAWERIVFSLTEIRAYSCNSCGASFYARRKVEDSLAALSLFLVGLPIWCGVV